MSILIIAPGREMIAWKKAIQAIDSDVEVEIYPEVKDPEKVTAAVVWHYPHGLLLNFPNLKWVSSLGAGVDHILNDPQLPPQVRIARVVDEGLALDMTRMAISIITIFERKLLLHYQNQKASKWEPSFEFRKLIIGILGMGHIGKKMIDSFSLLGYEVRGLSLSGNNYAGYKIFKESELTDFLSEIDVAICLMPLTEKTENFINKDFFLKMKKGSYFINLARGKIVEDEALLMAVEQGIIAGAHIDVFREEPLPVNHPFWQNETIFITPHISGITHIETGARQLVENYQLFSSRGILQNQIDKNKGY